MNGNPAPDLIGRDFHAERPGTKLAGDVTYLPTAEGWLYLACQLDLATREVVGYAMAGKPGARLRDRQRSRQRIYVGSVPAPNK
ncbi:hypothetical protein [Streptomyces mirabilis]|uniref:hypothetical protein n=1 Tax=Streptomyces mirabilis TaxID=68239 RepID=UPI0036A87AC9